MRALLAGALAGLLATVLLTMVLPKKWGHLRAVVGALGGFLLALGTMYLMDSGIWVNR